jgi:hypothetical protein
VVDAIEDGEFAAPPASRLKAKRTSSNRTFGADVCVNCDARFSCASYREYVRDARGPRAAAFRDYYDELPSERESDDRRDRYRAIG